MTRLASNPEHAQSEDEKNERAGESIEVILQELRVALPGMQMQFAFLLTVPFSQRFEKLTEMGRWVFFGDLIATTLSCIFLIAPSVYHRIHHRRSVGDKQLVLRVFNALAIVGGAFLSIAIVASVHLITDFLFGRPTSTIAASATGIICVALWYALPLYRRSREQPTED